MKDIDFSMEEMLPLLSEVLESGGEFRFYPKGTSMLPLLRQGVDSVALVEPERLKKGDICLFRRADGAFVLHRLVGIQKDGRLSFRGDNQAVTETDVDPSRVIAVASRVFRGERAVKPYALWYRITRLSALARVLRFKNKRNRHI